MISTKFFFDTLLKDLLKKSLKPFIIKILITIVNIYLSIILTNYFLNEEDFGLLNISIKICHFLMILSVFGNKHLLIRDTSNSQLSKSEVDKEFSKSLFIALIFSFALILSFYFFSNFITEFIFQKPSIKPILLIFLIGVFFQAITTLFSGYLIGVEKIWQGTIYEQVLSIFIVFLFLLSSIVLDIKLNIIDIAYLYLISRLITFLSLIIFYKNINLNFNFTYKSIVDKINYSIPFIINSISSLVFTNLDILIIGITLSLNDVALYSIVSRLALLITFPSQIIQNSISPKISKFYSNSSFSSIKKLVQKTTKLYLILALILVLLIIIFGEFVLSFWGDFYTKGYMVLIILSVGQLINLVFSTTGPLLSMTKNHGYLSQINLYFLPLSLLVMFFSSLFFGLIGHTFAMLFLLILINVWKLYYVRLKLNINIF